MSQDEKKGPPGGSAPPTRSGRVQFDDRGQAIWEWSVQTGMFDRNASTQRIRALTQGVDLRIEDGTLAAGAAPPGAPQPSPATPRTAPAAAPAAAPRSAKPSAPPEPGENAGFDPYSRGPTRSPESVSYDPYARRPPRK